MADALAGRVALVTGASRGIGAAIATRFAAEGAAVAIAARSLEPGSGGHLAGSLRETADGWIVDITSAIVDTDQLDSPQQARSSTYAPSKAALDRLTVSFATELRGTGIAVNALAPERAVATEGATAVMDLPPEWCEPVDLMAAAAVELASCDPERENGLVVRSGPYLRERGLVS